MPFSRPSMMRRVWRRPEWLCALSLLLTALPALAAESGGPRGFSWLPFLAPLHSVVLHLPIGFIAIALILELYRWRHPGEELRKATVLVNWLGLGAAIVAAGLGLMRAQGGDYEVQAMERHRAYGLAVPVMCLIVLVAQYVAHRKKTAMLTGVYRLLLIGSVGLVSVAGHQGGTLTHGSRYLVENAPEFIRDFVEGDAPEEVPVAASDEKQKFYAEKVEPLLNRRCYSCHSETKQKGGYRLDQPDVARQGGESGKPAITPGDPFASEMVRRILLPADHDDVMPPNGKQLLSSEEIMTLIEWIRQGAVFPEAPAAKDGATNAVPAR